MSPLQIFLIVSLLLISIPLSQAQPQPQPPRRPNALVLPITKHHTHQFLTNLSIGTPPVPTTFVVDLGGKNLWIACETKHHSSTFRPVRCGSASCSFARANAHGCTNNNMCSISTQNTVTNVVSKEKLVSDTIYFPSTNGSTPGPPVKTAGIVFACARNQLLKGLAGGAKGMIGLGKSPTGLTTQISASLGPNFSRKFAICLPSSPSLFQTYSHGHSNKGALFFGKTRYLFYPSYNESRLIDMTQRFSYTKLHFNPTSPSDYFVQVTSILINKKPIPINKALLTINNQGTGGTQISTIASHTVLESSIYKIFAQEFVKELKAMRVTKVAPVGPYTECFSTEFLAYTPLGAAVPDVTFVFENKDVYWELNGFNVMVEISREVVCLAFIDGGSRPKASIVIGAHQMEDQLLEFDLAASRLGFSYTSLLFEEVLCSNFKF